MSSYDQFKPLGYDLNKEEDRILFNKNLQHVYTKGNCAYFFILPSVKDSSCGVLINGPVGITISYASGFPTEDLVFIAKDKKSALRYCYEKYIMDTLEGIHTEWKGPNPKEFLEE